MPIKKSHGAFAVVAAILVAALPGVASAAEGSATACPTPALSKPFTAIGDVNSYFLAPGGDFEEKGIWSVSDSAEYVDGQRPGEYGGSQVLHLDSGDTATSPAFCVDDTYPHIRLAAKSDSRYALLTVEAIPVGGTPILLDTLTGSQFRSWSYSGFVPLAPAVGLTVGQATQLKLRVRAIGNDWQIDAVAVDPRSGG
jgi:hypothetical protein